MDKYDHKKIESKWQKKWGKTDLYKADDKAGNKKYILDMFPYPSGAGLHVGHVESYTATDIYCRYLRMNGYNVLHPQGFDAFGLPAENYAIKTNVHPAQTTKKSIETFKRQMNSMGFSYDWSREVNSSFLDYYKWTQWLFLLLYKNGLAYQKEGSVNWCETCQTVLANEQVISGECERCGGKIVQKNLKQWFFKITDFIEDQEVNGKKIKGLLSGLDDIDWPESTKIGQKNWIGKSEGNIVKFKIRISKENNSSLNTPVFKDEYLNVFTTRIDTIFGCTYMVVSPEHELIENYKLQITNYSDVEKYIEDSKRKTELERIENKEKTGVEIKGLKAVNPFNNEGVPIFLADYVLGHYGTGAVMAVPAHDERDFEFAEKYNLPIKDVVMPIFGKENKGEEFRKTISALVHRKKDDKFLLQYVKHYDVVATIVGGIDKNESLKEAAEREVYEESGYKVRFVRKLGSTVESHFYASHKNIWRHRLNQPVELELVDENAEPDEIAEEEREKHEVLWLSREEALSKIKNDDHRIDLLRYLEIEKSFVGEGRSINSDFLTGLKTSEAKKKANRWLEQNKLGRAKINYKLRDWLVSRQRYWGAPIPIIYCEKCGAVPVPEKDLPVILPTDVDFHPSGKSPLVDSREFQDVKCPACGAKAKRESDTMDTFVCSSWYYLRYADPKNEKEFASKKMLEKWLPVDVYVGGAEHTVLHLLYSRFFTKVLQKYGYLDFNEPFLKMRHQGIILAEDGNKMSKSKGNVINPDDVVEEFGADALRMYEMFMGPLEDAKPRNTRGIIGIYRFLERIYKLKSKIKNQKSKVQIENQKLEVLINKTIKKVTEDIEAFKFNTAISSLMILANEMEKSEENLKSQFSNLIILLSPFAPHLTEELWEKLGHKESIFRQKWPQYDPELVKDETAEMIIQINGKLRDRIKVPADISEEEVNKLALKSEKVKKFIGGKEIKKMIFVKGRLLNVVLK